MPGADDVHRCVCRRGGGVSRAIPSAIIVGDHYGKTFFLPLFHPGLHRVAVRGAERLCRFGTARSLVLEVGGLAHIVEGHRLAVLRLGTEDIQQGVPIAFRLQRLSIFALSHRINDDTLFGVVVALGVSVAVGLIRFVTSREGKCHYRY